MAVTIKREDQTTFILIFAVLVVCIIALISIINLIWGIIEPPISLIVSEFQIEAQRYKVVDYNFEIPKNLVIPEVTITTTLLVTPTPTIVPTEKAKQPRENEIVNTIVNYNFLTPEKTLTFTQDGVGLKDSILEEANKFYKVTDQDVSYRIKIPKIGVNSLVESGEPERVLSRNFWFNSTASRFGEGEIVVFCYRTFFEFKNPNSCYFLDKIMKGDFIELMNRGQTKVFEVVGINIWDREIENIYQGSNDQNLLKIITANLPDKEKRLVILARSFI